MRPSGPWKHADEVVALVSPMRGKPPLAPDETGSFQIVFTAQPGRMESLGWDVGDSRTSRLLGLDAFNP
jgi:hypothetical protein